jgi:hypothetical protein
MTMHAGEPSDVAPTAPSCLVHYGRMVIGQNIDCKDRVIVVGRQPLTGRNAEGKSLAKMRVVDPAVETPSDKRNRLLAEGKLAMAEHAARAAAIDKNTQRLRALRLAKEAADREAALLNPPPEKPKRKTPAKK